MTQNVALIGTGMVAPTYVNAIKDIPELTLAGILSRSPESGLAFANDYAENTKAYSDINEVLEDKSLSFVILATPPNARHEYITSLAKARLPVLCEKPLERTAAQAAALVETMEAAGLPFGVMFQHRMRPAALKLAECTKTLGDLRAIEISVPWWRPQSYYDEPGRGSFSRDGGGVMISQAIHSLDLALQFTGPVTTVTARSATTQLHKMEAEDFVTAGLTFASGIPGSFTASTASFPGRPECITLHCSGGSARLEGSVLDIHYQNGTSETYGEASQTGSGSDPMAFGHVWHQSVIEDFAEAVRNKRSAKITARSALEVHRLISAIEASAKAGSTVSLI